MHVEKSEIAGPPPENVSPMPPVIAPYTPPTPMSWRLAIGAAIVATGTMAYLMRDAIGLRGQSLAGVFCFFGIVAAFSQNLRLVNWRTIFWGVALQVLLAVLVLQVPVVEKSIEKATGVVSNLINYSNEGATFVFGNLADGRPPDNEGSPDKGGSWSRLFPGGTYRFQFAFIALPPILFISALFTVLYHYGILQWCVKLMARGMVHLLGTSGAETLSVAANVFMGQTEAPLIVKPYVPRMTNSELFVLMASGMAHISGGMMVVYIAYGANSVAVLTTCVMACPCSLYLGKLFMPETTIPETSGKVHLHDSKSPYANAIDAAAAGTSDGLRLALNVAAMLIVFVAFVAMFNGLLGSVKPALIGMGISPDTLEFWPEDLTLQQLFGYAFAPVAFLMGVDLKDIHQVGTLLGTKLAMNEHVAFLEMKHWKTIADFMTPRSYKLAAFALTGFANFSSIGIQLGGIGALAPDRRHDLARLGGRALFVGFTATLLNAAIAGVMLPVDD